MAGTSLENFYETEIPGYSGSCLSSGGFDVGHYEDSLEVNPDLTGRAVEAFEYALESVEKDLVEFYDVFDHDDTIIDTAAVYGSVGCNTAMQGSDLESLVLVNEELIYREGAPDDIELIARTADLLKNYENELPDELSGGLDTWVLPDDNFQRSVKDEERSNNAAFKASPTIGGPTKDSVSPENVESIWDLKGQDKVGLENRFIQFPEIMAAVDKGSYIPEGFRGENVEYLDRGINTAKEDGELEKRVNNHKAFGIEGIAASQARKKKREDTEEAKKMLGHVMEDMVDDPENPAQDVTEARERLEEVL